MIGNKYLFTQVVNLYKSSNSQSVQIFLKAYYPFKLCIFHGGILPIGLYQNYKYSMYLICKHLVGCNNNPLFILSASPSGRVRQGEREDEGRLLFSMEVMTSRIGKMTNDFKWFTMWYFNLEDLPDLMSTTLRGTPVYNIFHTKKVWCNVTLFRSAAGGMDQSDRFAPHEYANWVLECRGVNHSMGIYTTWS